MPKLILNDGTAFPAAWCFADGRALMAEIRGAFAVLELAALLSAPANTARIVFATDNAQTEHAGYTRLMSVTIGKSPEGAQIILEKEA